MLKRFSTLLVSEMTQPSTLQLIRRSFDPLGTLVLREVTNTYLHIEPAEERNQKSRQIVAKCMSSVFQYQRSGGELPNFPDLTEGEAMLLFRQLVASRVIGTIQSNSSTLKMMFSVSNQSLINHLLNRVLHFHTPHETIDKTIHFYAATGSKHMAEVAVITSYNQEIISYHHDLVSNRKDKWEAQEESVILHGVPLEGVGMTPYIQARLELANYFRRHGAHVVYSESFETLEGIRTYCPKGAAYIEEGARRTLHYSYFTAQLWKLGYTEIAGLPRCSRENHRAYDPNVEKENEHKSTGEDVEYHCALARVLEMMLHYYSDPRTRDIVEDEVETESESDEDSEFSV